MATTSRSRRNDSYNFSTPVLNSFQPTSNHDTTKNVVKLSATPLWLMVFVFHASVVLYADVVNRPFFSPQPKPETSSSATEFVEKRVRRSVEALTAIGQRTVGSYENEVLAKDFLVGKIELIQKELSASASHKITIDIQNVSGAFHLQFLSGMQHVYENVKNVVVKLEPANGANDSLLVNCHYDTFINSKGASDDAASCCVMIETLRAISQTSSPLKHNIIFLFNGGEENCLQASHGFITKHKWAKEVKAFVNLDSAGAGGRELVFQSGPEHPWIITAYAEAAHYPFATALGPDLFRTGVVPGDTDFRIFRDHGNISGLDMAYISNGFVYHTKYDTPDMIPDGSLQRAGENLLALLLKLGNSETLADPGPERHGEMVFFDVGSQFIVAYPQRLGTIINSLAIILVILSIFYKISGNNKTLSGVEYLKLLGSAVLAILVTWILELVVTVTMALFVTVIGRSMSWFTYSFNLAVLYIIPAVLASLLFHSYLQKTVFRAHNPWLMESTFFEASLTIWSLITAIVTQMGLCSGYLPMLWVLGPVLIRQTLMYLLNFQPKDKPIYFLVLHVLGVLVPTLCYLYALFIALELFLPIMGRVGQGVPPDIPIGLLVLLGVIPCTTYQVGLVYISDTMERVCKVLAGVVVLGLSLIIFTPLGFPYSYTPKTPVCQRHSFIVGELTYTDSGIWNMPLDYFGDKFISSFVPELKTGKPFIPCREPYCGAPMYFPVIDMLEPSSTTLIPGSRLIHVKPRLKMRLTGRDYVDVDVQRLTFSVTGPDHMTVYISPTTDVNLLAWSLGEGVPEQTGTPSYTKRLNYFIFYSYAEQPASPWTFYLDFQVLEGHSKSLPIVDIAFSGHYIHGKHNTTVEIERILSKLPPWSCIMSFVSTFDSYQF